MHTATVITTALVMALGAQAAPMDGKREVVERAPQAFLEGLADLFKMSDLMGAGVDTDGGDQGSVTQNADGGVTVGIGSTDIKKRSPQAFLEGLADLFKMSDGMAAGVDTDGDEGGITQNSDGTATVSIGSVDIKRSPQGIFEGLEDLFKLSDGMAAGVDTDGDEGGITQNSDGTATVNIGDTDI